MAQRDLSGRLARWSLKLQPYNIDIEHCPGSNNIVPDTLSRVHCVDCLVKDSTKYSIIDLNHPAFQGSEYLAYIKELDNGHQPSNVKVEAGIVYLRVDENESTDIPEWKIVVPTELTAVLISKAHDAPTSAHCGVSKTLEILRRLFYWKGMAKEVREYVKNCDACRTSKTTTKNLTPPMGNSWSVEKPFQRLYIDFLGPYPRSKKGNTHIIIVLDQFSKFVFLQPLRSATAASVVEFLGKIFNMFGVPEYLLSDNGKQFVSKEVDNLLKEKGVIHTFTAKYSPQANASERVNVSVLAAIRSYLKDEHSKWDEHLDEIGTALRNRHHDSTSFSPYFLVFGHHYIGHGSEHSIHRKLNMIEYNYLNFADKVDRLTLSQQKVLAHLNDAYTRNKRRYDLRSRSRTLDIGQEVYVRNFCQSKAGEKFAAKLAPRKIKGIVTRSVGNVIYDIAYPDGKPMGTYHLKDLI